MPYDLYGQYYASSRDAQNAELAQMAEIDARLAYNKAQENERRLEQLQRLHSPQDEEQISNLWQYVQMLEERIKYLETITEKIRPI